MPGTDSEDLVNACLNNDYEAISTSGATLERLSQTTFSLPSEQTLFALGATPNEPLSSANVSLMHIAAYADSLEVFLYLEERGVPLDILSAESYLPLHYACEQNSTEVCLYILSRCPDLASKRYGLPFTLIFLATRANSFLILKELFRLGASLSDPAAGPNDPLNVALRSDSYEVLRLLLEEGFKADSTAPSTLLLLAIKHKVPQAVPLLLQAGEDPSVFENGWNALHSACFNRMVPTVALLCAVVSTVEPDREAIKHSVARSHPVHWGCQCHSPEIVAILVKKGIDVNALDERGLSGPAYMVDLGTEEEVTEILELLYGAGLDVEAGGRAFQERTKFTPVSPEVYRPKTILAEFVLSMKKRPRPIKWLLDRGADPAVRVTALQQKDIPLVELVMKNKIVYRKIVPLFQPYYERYLAEKAEKTKTG